MTGLNIPSSYRDENKDRMVYCRLNQSQYNWIKSIANESDMTVSGIIRFLVDREMDETE